MKKVRSLRIIVLASLIVTVLLTAAAPGPATISTPAVQARSELVRLTVVNRTESPIFLRLQGPAFYFLYVNGGESRVFTVKRGEYDSTFTACGVTTSETMDLTRQKKLIMPVCGGRAHAAQRTSTKVDLSEQIRIVSATIVNEADTQVLAILTGAATYVFLLDREAERDVTIAKGDYDVKIYACRAVTTIEFSSYKNSKLALRCPQHYTD